MTKMPGSFPSKLDGCDAPFALGNIAQRAIQNCCVSNDVQEFLFEYSEFKI